MKKSKSTCPVVFILICVCFIFGIIAGSVYESVTESTFLIDKIALNETIPQKMPFYMLFIKNIKFGIVILILSFISIGIPLILSVFILNGIFYGCAFSHIISLNGFNGFKTFVLTVLPYSMLRLMPLVFAGCFSSLFIMHRFFKERSSKSYLKREIQKTKLEFAIVFFMLCIITFASCLLETKLNMPPEFYQ